MLRKIASFSIKYRYLVILFFILTTIFFARQMKNTEFDGDIKSMLPEDLPAKINQDKVEDIFGGTEFIMIAFKTDDVINTNTLNRIRKISRTLEKTEGVDKVLSLSTINDIRGNEGDLLVERFYKRAPKSSEGLELLKDKIKSNDMVYGEIISEDFVTTSIITFVKEGIDESNVVISIKKILEEIPGDEEVYIGGLPFIRTSVSKSMRSDLRKFLPFGLLIMLIFLYLCFKELKGVFLPFLIVIMSIIVSMGFISLLGWKIQLVTIIMPVILIAVANDYGIHIVAKYQEECRDNPDDSKSTIIKNTISSLGGPVIAAGLTTAAGMIALLSHVIVPAKELGILAAIGIIFALLGSITFIPASLSFSKKSKVWNKKAKTHLLENILKKTSILVSKKAKTLIISFIILVLIISSGIFRLVIDTNPINYFDKNNPIVKADNIINDYYGGSTNISIISTGDIKDPKIMNEINDLENTLRSRKLIGNVSSIAEVIRRINKSLNEDTIEYDKIPKLRNTIAEYFLIYSMNGDPEDFEKRVDFNYENALVNARIPATSINAITDEVKFIKDFVNKNPDSSFTTIGGYAGVLAELVTATVKGQLISLIIALILVFLIVSIIFKSFSAGFLSSLPLIIAIPSLFGLMGYSNIELNIITAMLTAMMIGIGVDYSIHFLWKYKELLNSGSDHKTAATKSITTIGRGIVFNALSVIIGFLVLMISNFLPVKFFGFLVVVSISTCLLASLVFLPSICIIFKPNFKK